MHDCVLPSDLGDQSPLPKTEPGILISSFDVMPKTYVVPFLQSDWQTRVFELQLGYSERTQPCSPATSGTCTGSLKDNFPQFFIRAYTYYEKENCQTRFFFFLFSLNYYQIFNYFIFLLHFIGELILCPVFTLSCVNQNWGPDGWECQPNQSSSRKQRDGHQGVYFRAYGRANVIFATNYAHFHPRYAEHSSLRSRYNHLCLSTTCIWFISRTITPCTPPCPKTKFK